MGGKFVASKVFVRKLQFTCCLLQHHNCGLEGRWHYVGVVEMQNSSVGSRVYCT